jgi:hypothetical protein
MYQVQTCLQIFALILTEACSAFLQLLDFIAAAFSVPDSYAYHVPLLAEYYARYHFSQVLRLYYAALPIPADDIIRCRGHLKVRNEH